MLPRLLENEQGLIIADMLTYQRLLEGKKQFIVAGIMGIGISTLHQLEACSPGITIDLLPKIGDFLRFDIETLMSYVAEIKREKDQLDLDVGSLTLSERQVVRGKPPQLRKRYSLKESRYGSPEDTKTANTLAVNTSELPCLDIGLFFVNPGRLLEDGKIPLVERVLTKPFRLVFKQHQVEANV